MFILGLFSLLFCIDYCSENRLKINITSYLWSLNSKNDLKLECENDVKLPNVLFGGKKK